MILKQCLYYILLDRFKVDKIIVIIIGSILLFSCYTKSEKYTKYIADLKSNSIEDRYNSIIKLHKSGKTVIPELINSINENRKIFFL